MAKVNIADYIKSEDERIAKEEAELWNYINMGSMMGPPTAGVDLADSKKYQEIVQLLHLNPILVEPCLDWLKTVAGQMEIAKLEVLYGKEQVAKMMEAERAKEAAEKKT